jgi:SLOG family YspA-like protein
MTTDLFGHEVPEPLAIQPARTVTNDMDLMESVLGKAIQTGYRLVGAQERVYRCTGREGEIEPVPRHEEDAVHQLITQKYLEIGGTHVCTWRQYEGPARSVLVPKRTRQLAARWGAYHRPTTWGPRRHDTGAQGRPPPSSAPPRILVTGSRSWCDTAQLRAVLCHWHRLYPTAVLVYGDARGADRLAASLWKSWGGHTEAHPAAWSTHGRRAGFLRNQQMVTLGATICLAFIRQGSSGASQTARLAEAAGIPTIRTERTD